MLQGMNIHLFLIFIFAFLGIVFLICSLGMFFSYKKKKKNCTQLVKAEIVDVVRFESTDFDIHNPTVSWYPVYEYKVNSVCRRKQASVGTATKKYVVGDVVDLYVNPNDLDEFYRPSNTEKIIYSILFLVGVFMLASCFICIYIYRI